MEHYRERCTHLFLQLLGLAFYFRKRKRYKTWWLRQLEVKRHLSEYSIRTAEDNAERHKPMEAVNYGFEDNDNSQNNSPESSPQKSSPESSPQPGSSTSADIHNSEEESSLTKDDQKIIDDNMNDIKEIHIL